MSKKLGEIFDEVYWKIIGEAEAIHMDFNQRASDQASKETHFCGSGCDACCCQLFSVNDLEIGIIIKWLNERPDLLASFRERNSLRNELLAQHADAIAEIRKIEDFLDFAIAWRKLQIPCAFLRESRCTIYEVRPFVCATYLSMAPPRICRLDMKGYKSNEMRLLVNEQKQALIELLKKYDYDLYMRPDLSKEIEKALDKFEATGKEVKG